MNGKKTQRAVVSCGERICYTLEYKKIKNINLRVHPDGEVFVSAPLRCPAERVDRFVSEKGAFIFAARKKLEVRRPPEQKKLESGETYRILGRTYRIAVVKAENERVQSEGDVIYIYAKNPEDAARRQKLFNDWLIRRCEKVFGETADAVCEKLKVYGVPHASITVKDMKSRWGSCKPSEKRITLNKQLIKADEECVEYVIVHEYAHFLHPDHSPAFHAFVGSVLPDWKERSARLKKVEIVKGQ
ncbi:MAG: M48 family metallopeptidase [Clostridia bacterium]|nr:M48 family metallopeptidase [Clostridia bacterium]